MRFDVAKYDEIELHPCCIADTYELAGRKYQAMEQVGEDDPNIAVWAVYGHIPNAGLEWLCDCEDKGAASEIRDHFQLMLDARSNCPHWNAEQDGDEVECSDCGLTWAF